MSRFAGYCSPYRPSATSPRGKRGATCLPPPHGGGGRAACGEVGRGIISSLGEAELHSFIPFLPPAFAAAAAGHQPDAFGFRRGLRIAGGVHTLPYRFKAPELLLQLPIPSVFRMIHPLFLPFQPMRALEKRCELCHNISYENVGLQERF